MYIDPVDQSVFELMVSLFRYFVSVLDRFFRFLSGFGVRLKRTCIKGRKKKKRTGSCVGVIN